MPVASSRRRELKRPVQRLHTPLLQVASSRRRELKPLHTLRGDAYFLSPPHGGVS